MSERPYSKAGYCDVCTRWYEIPASGNCDCGGKILLTPGTQFSRDLVQVPYAELEELVNNLDCCRTEPQQIKAAAKFRAKYLEGK